MDKETLDYIAAAQHLEENSLQVTPVEGGFTEATKYVVKGSDRDAGSRSVFAKVIQETASALERAVLDTEAQMYTILANLGLTGEYFPAYMGYVKTPNQRALLIEYLGDVSWGGPWNQANIEKLHSSIDAVHDTPLTATIVEEIKRTAHNLNNELGPSPAAILDPQEKDGFFHAAWQAHDSLFVNSRGTPYFTALKRGSVEELLAAEASYNKDQPLKLVLNDLNFGNLAVASDRVRFVDPVYLNVGNPTFDLTVLGVNILGALPEGAQNLDVHDLVISIFFQDEAALAHLIKYWVACTALSTVNPHDAWMDFQQSCAVTALTVWAERNG